MKSKTVLGALICIAMPMLLCVFTEPSMDGTRVYMEKSIFVALMVVNLVGGLLCLWGRVTATDKVRL